MIRDIFTALRLHSRYGTTEAPVYNYKFAFDGEWNIAKKVLNITLPGESTKPSSERQAIIVIAY